MYWQEATALATQDETQDAEEYAMSWYLYQDKVFQPRDWANFAWHWLQQYTKCKSISLSKNE